ncbi:MAG: aminotransferase class V-fold PLP-dependent enzyme [Wenzhouxiangella sp.]|nr:MAG: aminotransferase class V-fold PLP-dependent enzyme [Wenzhouxiangella sp.]
MHSPTEAPVSSSSPPARAALGSRALFPDLEVAVYLNHASLSPPSEPVRQAVRGVLDGYARHGMLWYREEMERRERLRGQLARLINATAENMALVPNTSAGVMTVALCLPWRRGDRIVLFKGEFPTNVTPWQQAARRHGLEILWMETEAFRHDRPAALEALEDHLRAGVRLVAVSAVQFTTGQRMPLEAMGELCHRHGSELFVDAIQAAGVVPLDVQAMHIDYLTAGSHKWLMAPEGLAAFYASPEAAERLEPNVAAWLSHEDPFAFLTEGPGQLRYDRPIVQSARMAEAGTFNVLATAGLEASLGLIEQLGVAAILEHVQSWHDAAEPGLIERGFESARMAEYGGRSGILSVRPPDPSTTPAWARALAEHGIGCGTPDGWLRLSPHWPNAPTEIEQLMAAVDRVLAEGLPDGPGP